MEPIVGSAHLVSDRASELSEFEYGLMMASHAFDRWIMRCMRASGYDMGALEVMVLHIVAHRMRQKRLSDVCFSLNIEDTHLVNYALKKLMKAGLLNSVKKGKEVFYSASVDGEKACLRYREIREACLVDSFSVLGGVDAAKVSEMAKSLRALSGLYDQAARSASSL